ncbi:MAG: molecular chaperone TorD family protein, partial [bacterium]
AYCSTFLVSESVALYPYESCQRDGCLQGDSANLVQCFFQKCGLELPEESSEFPDHLGFEFDFMGKLAREESRWWEIGQTAAAERRRTQQMAFLGNHLLVWVPQYGKTVERMAAHPFYREIGRLTFDFMEMESKEFSRKDQGHSSDPV